MADREQRQASTSSSLIQFETSMSVWVAHGSVMPKSSKIFLNFGMIATMMNVRMATATKMTTAG